MSAEVVIVGLAAAKAALEQLHPKQNKGAERNGLRAGGNILAESARAKAPVDTGRLRDTGITVTTSVTNDKAGVHVGTTRIGRFNELGTRFMPAHPFLRPALDATETQIIQAYGDAYIASAVKRGAI